MSNQTKAYTKIYSAAYDDLISFLLFKPDESAAVSDKLLINATDVLLINATDELEIN